jgi:uncharacterized protein (DUF3084 family)
MGTALVVGLLVAMCGGIAYVGDLLGRRMGKKRLTLFGLRPRHTAVVFTVITGMVIAATTLGVLFFASAGVRFALTRGEHLVHENRRLTLERRQLQREHLQLAKQSRRLTESNDDLLKKNVDLQRTTTDLGQRNAALRAEANRLQGLNFDLQAKNDRLTVHNGKLEGRNRVLLADNHRLAGENARLARANRIFAHTNGQLLASNGELNRRNRGLQIAQAGLVQARDHAQRQLTRARSELITAKGDVKLAHAELNQTQKRALQVAERLREDTDRLRVQTDALRLEGQRAAEHVAELEAGQVVVRAREELARRVILPGSSAAEVRGAIERLLDDADAEVARRVGRSEATGGARPRRVRLSFPGGPSDLLIDAMVTRLMTESHPLNGQLPTAPMPEMHPLVVRALAHANTAAGTDDPVEVDVVGKINLLAFRKGQEVASLKVPTANTTGQLLKSLFSFLRGPVRETAMQHSVLPDPTGQVGEIDPEALLDVVAKVKRIPGQARVGAIVLQDTWSAGPLRLDFYVVPAETRVAKEKEKEEAE